MNCRNSDEEEMCETVPSSPNQDLHCRHGIMFFLRIKLYLREA